MNTVIEQRPKRLPMNMACQALGLNRSTVYARLKRLQSEKQEAQRSRKASVQPRALSEQERAHVIETLHSEPYRDQPRSTPWRSLSTPIGRQ